MVFTTLRGDRVHALADIDLEVGARELNGLDHKAIADQAKGFKV